MMKRIRLLIAVLTVFLAGFESRAQIPTTDGAVLGENVAQSIQNDLNHLDEMKQQLQQLLESKSINSAVSSAYRLISGAVKDAPLLRQLYQNYLQVQTDIEKVKTFAYYAESGQISPARLASMFRIADDILADAVEEFTYIKQYILSPDESISVKDRLEELEKLNAKLSGNSSLLNQICDDIRERAAKKAAEEQSQEYVKNAFNVSLAQNAPTLTPSIDFSDIPSLTAPRKIGSDTDVTGGYTVKDAQRKFTDKATVESIFNVASLLIGIIAVGYTAWNFAMKNSGERQRQDSQFKVFAGMLIGILLLQALKAMFF